MKPQYLFEDAGGFPVPVPYLTADGTDREPDGVGVLSLDQAVAKYGLPAPQLAAAWLRSWGASLPGPGVSTALTDSPSALPTEPNALREHVLRRMVCGHLSDEHYAQFKIVCQDRGLNPMWNQLHAETRVAGDGRLELVVITHIDGFRSLAIATGQFNGQGRTVWCGADGVWKDVWTDPATPPVACRYAVYRKGCAEPVEAVAHWDMYAQYIQTDKGPVLAEFWQRGGAHMLAKVAEALSLRKAFPEKFGGIYIADEMRGQLRPRRSPDLIQRRRGGAGGGGQNRPVSVGDGSGLAGHLDAEPMDARALNLTLIDWGLRTEAARAKVVARCRQDFGRGYGEGREDEFRGAVMAAVMAEPAKFGATPPVLVA